MISEQGGVWKQVVCNFPKQLIMVPEQYESRASNDTLLKDWIHSACTEFLLVQHLVSVVVLQV